MKKLSAIGMFILAFALISGKAIAIQYNTDISPELTIEVGECFYMDVKLDDVPEPLVTAGFFIVHDASLALIADVAVYDGELNPDIWDPGFTHKVPDAAGPGTYFLACGNFGTVSPDDVRIAKVEICAITEGVNTITISTIPDFQTVVALLPEEIVVYDSEILPHEITVHQIIPPCRCEIVGSTIVNVDAFQEVTAQYDVSSNLLHCDNPPDYVWSDDCTLADIDQSGLLTVPPTQISEVCTITVLDTANIDINTGEQVQCNYPISLEGAP